MKHITKEEIKKLWIENQNARSALQAWLKVNNTSPSLYFKIQSTLYTLMIVLAISPAAIGANAFGFSIYPDFFKQYQHVFTETFNISPMVAIVPILVVSILFWGLILYHQKNTQVDQLMTHAVFKKSSIYPKRIRVLFQKLETLQWQNNLDDQKIEDEIQTPLDQIQIDLQRKPKEKIMQSLVSAAMLIPIAYGLQGIELFGIKASFLNLITFSGIGIVTPLIIGGYLYYRRDNPNERKNIAYKKDLFSWARATGSVLASVNGLINIILGASIGVGGILGAMTLMNITLPHSLLGALSLSVALSCGMMSHRFQGAHIRQHWIALGHWIIGPKKLKPFQSLALPLTIFITTPAAISFSLFTATLATGSTFDFLTFSDPSTAGLILFSITLLASFSLFAAPTYQRLKALEHQTSRSDQSFWVTLIKNIGLLMGGSFFHFMNEIIHDSNISIPNKASYAGLSMIAFILSIAFGITLGTALNLSAGLPIYLTIALGFSSRVAIGSIFHMGVIAPCFEANVVRSQHLSPNTHRPKASTNSIDLKPALKTLASGPN